MIARKCDRCGKLYEVYSKKYHINEKEFEIDSISLLGLSVRGDLYDRQVYFDLCPDCLEEAVSFIRNKERVKSKDVGDGRGGRFTAQPVYCYKECKSCGSKYPIERHGCPFCNATTVEIKWLT